MPRGGFGGGRGGGFGGGRGFGGGGFGMRRVGFPLMGMGMGGYGGGYGSPLLSTLMAGGLGYMMGSNSTQQTQQPMQPYQPYPYQGAAPQGQPTNTDSGKLAQIKLLGELRESGTLTNDEFEREKQRILQS